MHLELQTRAGNPARALHPTPLAHAVATALLSMALGGAVLAPAYAQTNTATNSAVKSYNIPAGPLSQALYSFAGNAGITLSFEPGLTEGLRSNGLHGNYSVQQGLDALLSGHNLEAIPGVSGGYRLRKGNATVLPAVSVTDSTLPTVNVNAISPKTENSGLLGSSKATIFRGLDSVREIPQPVTVITRQLIEDRGFFDLHDVLQNTPGIAVDYTDSERVTFHSRGYGIDSLQVDGQNIYNSGSHFIQPDAAVLDRIEILRGASGMLRGAGNPSATINMVRKRPTAQFQGSAGLTLGSWNRRRLDVDLSSPLNEAGTLRGRVVAVLDEKDFFQKVRHEDRKIFYGVIEADLGPQTTLTTSVQYSDLNATGAWGNLPGNFDGSPLNLPRDTYLGSDWNRWNRYNQQASVGLEHHFENGWTGKLNASYTGLRLKDHGFKQTYFTRASTTNPYLFSVASAEYTGATSDQVMLNAIADGPFHLFGREHKLILGVESQHVKSLDSWGSGSYAPQIVDIRAFDPYSTYPERTVPGGTRSAPNITTQKAIFGTTRFSLTDKLSAITGARLSWYDYESISTPRNSYKVTQEMTPYAGLIYDLSKQISAYASFAEIFATQSLQGKDGLLPPIRGEDYEAGLKGEFFGGRLNASFSIFRINNLGKGIQDTSTAGQCPVITGNAQGYCYAADGKTVSEGWELELAGEISPGWQVMGGYTNTRAKYERDSTNSNNGQLLRSIDPKHQLRFFSTYRLGSEQQGWTIGGGAQIQSDSFVRSGTLTSYQGGYAIYNAMASYRFDKNYSIQINVNNLFDKVYYKKFAPTGISYYYGDPRNIMVSFRAKF